MFASAEYRRRFTGYQTYNSTDCCVCSEAEADVSRCLQYIAVIYYPMMMA